MFRKKFDKKLFEENDPPTRKIAIKYFEAQGFVVEENPKKLGLDLLLFDKQKNFVRYIEVERKKVWKEDNFQYPDVQFLARKDKKILEAINEGKEVFYFMTNLNWTRAIIVSGKEVLNSPIQTRYTKYNSKEDVHNVPLTKVKIEVIK